MSESPIFQLADRHVSAMASHSPIESTFLGVSGSDHLLDDFSPESREEACEIDKATLAELDSLEPTNDADRVAKAVMKERIETYLAQRLNEEDRLFGVLIGPVMAIREVLEVTASTNAEQFESFASRMGAIPKSLNSWRRTLERGIAEGRFAARRQAIGVAQQCDQIASGGLLDVAQRAAASASTTLDNHDLAAKVDAANAALTDLATFLRSTYAPAAPEHDGVGRARYELGARSQTGAILDLEETYEWGTEELARINARMWTLAAKVAPGATSLAEVAEVLDRDPSYQIHGEEALLRQLREFTDAAVERLDGGQFDIDPRVRFCDARLAPAGAAAAAYYQPPSEDLTRPGTTWFPTMGKTTFAWWRSVSTWYHEAVPGHHLQCATAILEKERLSRFQRTAGWCPGYGEGWALYAERLMDEMGAFEDPGHEMGYLTGQSLRAARVVVDIGMHLGLQVPKDFGPLGNLGVRDGEIWDARLAVACLMERAMEEEDVSVSEVERYLSWPGQAISYKVGERVWLKVRADAKSRLGNGFDIKSFHRHALRLGPMGLDPFEAEMGLWDGR